MESSFKARTNTNRQTETALRKTSKISTLVLKASLDLDRVKLNC